MQSAVRARCQRGFFSLNEYHYFGGFISALLPRLCLMLKAVQFKNGEKPENTASIGWGCLIIWPSAGTAECPLHLITQASFRYKCPVMYNDSGPHTPSALNYADLYLFDKEASSLASVSHTERRSRGCVCVSMQKIEGRSQSVAKLGSSNTS